MSSRTSERTGADAIAWAERGLIIALGIIALVLLIGPILRLPLVTSLNYNEGWNAFNADRAWGAGALYPDPSALNANNYPPLSFYVVGLVGHVVSDNIVAGRAIALLSLLIVALNVGLATRRLGGSATIAWFAGVLFLASAITRCRAYTGMNDPQWFAHALMTTGLVVFLGSNHRSRRVVLTAVLMFVGGLAKHSLLSLPVAVTLWLLIYDRPRFLVWLVTSTLLIIGSAIGLYLAYGTNFFVGVLSPGRGLTLEKLRWVKLWIGKFALLLPAPFILAFTKPRPEVVLVVIYALIAALWGSFIALGEAVSLNAMFDLYIALSIAAGLAIEAVARRVGEERQRAVQLAGMIIVIIPVIWALPENLTRDLDSVRNLEATTSATRADIEYLAGIPGRAICEDLSLCYRAGKSFEMDFAGAGQMIALGRPGGRAIVEMLERQELEVVQLEASVDSRFYTNRLPRDVLRRALSGYRIDRRSGVGRVFLRPVRESEPNAPSGY